MRSAPPTLLHRRQVYLEHGRCVDDDISLNIGELFFLRVPCTATDRNSVFQRLGIAIVRQNRNSPIVENIRIVIYRSIECLWYCNRSGEPLPWMSLFFFKRTETEFLIFYLERISMDIGRGTKERISTHCVGNGGQPVACATPLFLVE